MAIIQAGFVRATEDIDLLVDAGRDNLNRLRTALLDLPDQAPTLAEDVDLENQPLPIESRPHQPTQVESPESSRALSMRSTSAFRKSARTSDFWDVSRSRPTDARERASSLPSSSGGRRFVA